MSMLIVLVLVAIVTLSEFVAESADKRVEIFAGQIFDLASQKLQSRRSLQGIAVHGTSDTRRCYHYKKQFFAYGKDVQTPAIPLACCAARLCAARLRLDCTKFRLPSRYAIRPLKVTIGGNANTISMLMVTPYSNMPLTRHIVTVPISRGEHY